MSEVVSQIGSFGDQLPAWVLAMSLWSGAVLVGALAADWLLRTHVSPTWRMALYLAVLVRVALPADWQSPLSVLPSSSSQTSANSLPSDLSPMLVEAEEPVLIGAPEVEPASVAVTSSASLRSGHLIAGAYGLGVLGLLGWMLVARRRLVRAVGEARPARARVAALTPASRVLEHPQLGPLAFGLGRGVIVLPRDVIDTLSDEELACVLAHERAHLERRDPWLALAVSLVVALAWPLLPVWLAAARVRQLIELAADERALARTRVRTYGQTLIKLADRVTPRLSLAAGLHLGSFSRLHGRVAALRHRSRLPAPVQLACVTGMAGLVLACAGLDGDLGDMEEDPEAVARQCDALQQNATVRHDQSEKMRDAATRERALEFYDEYTERCESHPHYAELLYYRAELIWAIALEAGRVGDTDTSRAGFAAAHKAFRLALEHHPERFTKDAAYGQLLSKWNEQERAPGEDPPMLAEQAPTKDKRERGSDEAQFPRSEYIPEELELLATYDTYQAHVDDPSDESLQQVLYHRTKLAMNHNRFDEAEASARTLLEGSDGTKFHAWAAAMLTDVLTIAWVDQTATPQARERTARRLDEWLTQVQTMQLYLLDEAEPLRGVVPVLQATIAAKQD
jgi:beta-lactamase regulating signal transducer with metallopeptidase domain